MTRKRRKSEKNIKENIKEAGEKVQIDTKYAFFGEIRYMPFLEKYAIINLLQ